MSTQNKFAVGDKVVWADEFYRGHFYPDCPHDAVLTVMGHDGDHGCECVLLKGPDQMDVEAFEERFKLYEEEGERGYIGEESFELVEQAPQTSNEKPPYLSFFTSVIVAKNKDVSDIGELLYDENTTKIYLEDEGGGAFLIVEQDYNGAIQQIRLDIEEADDVFSAIKQLVKQLDVRS